MAFKHDSGLHAGKWELEGVLVREAPSGKARLFDFGSFSWWLPKKWVTCCPNGAGKLSVYIPNWLYDLKVNEMLREQREEKVAP
jgi:hypothetical protein